MEYREVVHTMIMQGLKDLMRLHLDYQAFHQVKLKHPLPVFVFVFVP